MTAEDRLQNMLDMALQLTECVERRNISESDVVNDVDVRWMVSTPIAYLSEQAARMLSEHRDVAERLDAIDWYSLRGLRNRIVHDYDGVNFSLLASFVLHDVPDLIPELERALASVSEDCRES